MKRQLALAVVIMSLSLIASADQPGGEKLFNQAMSSWNKRGDPQEARKAMNYFRQAAQADPDNEQCFVMLAMACYWMGETTSEAYKKERVELYTEGEKAALKAISLNPQSIGGNFWSVINNGRVTELKGILSGSFNFGRCLRAMTNVSSKDPNYYYGGVYRYWAEFISEMPSMLRSLAQFTLDDSIYFSKRSIEIEPTFFMTRLYLAETYLLNKQREKAKKELLFVINAQPSILPDVEPENRHYQKLARELYDKEFGGKN